MTARPELSTLEQAKEQFLLANARFERNELDQARQHYEAALRLAPGRPSILANLGVTVFKLGELTPALDLLEQAARADLAMHADAWVALGLAREAHGSIPLALEALSKARTMGVNTAALWSAIARCETFADHLDVALHAWDRALALDPTLAQAWSERGSLLRHAGQLDAAAVSFRHAIEHGADPDLHRYYLQAVTSSDTPSSPPVSYVASLFDSYADDFEDHLITVLKYQAHTTLLAPLQATGQRFDHVLDLGCGTGLCAKAIAEQAAVIDGVDLAPAMVAKSRATGLYRHVEQADLIAFLQSSHEPCDLIIAADVLIYVGAVQPVLQAVASRLKPNGLFVLSVETTTNGAPLQLLPSLRYGHDPEALVQAAAAHGLRRVRSWQAPLREDQGVPILGHYIYLRRIV